MTRAEKLTLALKGKWGRTYGTAPCPAHEDSRPSLSIRDGDDEVILKCHAGCRSADIVSALRRVRLWPIGEDTTERRSSSTPDQKHDAALRIWHEAQPIAGTVAETYLRNRGITIPLPPTLRFRGALKHTPTGLFLPAMVAAVQGPDRRIIAIQRTYIDQKGRKAAVASPKMSLGALGTGAVRLAPAADLLGIAEGIETALSAMQLFGIPCWASLGGERLGKIELPPDMARVTIFADNGAAGRAAAMKAVETYTDQGRKVTLRFPPVEFGDFNDLLGKRAAA